MDANLHPVPILFMFRLYRVFCGLSALFCLHKTCILISDLGSPPPPPLLICVFCVLFPPPNVNVAYNFP